MKAPTLCGSDLHYFTHYRNGDIHIKEPLSQGHECAGLVVDVGSDVESEYGLKVGDRVALEVGVPCDECDECHEGAYNVCEKMRFRSSATANPHYQGTLQERFNHPAKWVHRYGTCSPKANRRPAILTSTSADYPIASPTLKAPLWSPSPSLFTRFAKQLQDLQSPA